ncbi:MULTISPECIES: hypothetical protein [unclassified Arenibacter]|jgi:hypothetical protein|uniref:hypothetical protein n=1 Tax=unclassified Arenibacter TaxID=2615047 RepID=UPI000E34C83B|nr:MULTISPECIES: hypothetical protein [unclassified Arenibacter]MCM4162247.1 hypothetical protein [Arenibacter sp. A80]RFT57853.1 hypothetical protein D0S24_01430 [Arenibacter sp. P308M17]
MGRILFYVIAFIWMGSCKQQGTKEVLEEKTEEFFSVDSLPKPNQINEEALAILKEWQEFNGLETSFESLYRVANREDLELVIEDLVEKQKTLEASTYPETFDKPQIKSRQKVFKTYILKTKGNLEYRDGTKAATVEMINAYNAFRNQFNVLVNSKLDTILILNE